MPSSNKEDAVKLIETVTEKMKTLKDKEDTVKILEALSQRAKFLENEEQNIIVTEKNNCVFENSCYAAKYKSSPCPCEFYRI
ncbi:MAG TPA: hypothetical protein DGG95_06355 [Cytophagales bacterium]|nr:hypothetical protein [Cytophagales bacterium]